MTCSRANQAARPTSKLPLPKGLGRREGTNNSLPPRRGKVRMGVKTPTQSPLPNKAATVNEQDKAIIKEFQRSDGQAATTGPPSAPRQSSSAGKSPETSNHTSPPTRTYSPTTDHSTKRNRQSSTKNRRHRLPQQATPTLRCGKPAQPPTACPSSAPHPPKSSAPPPSAAPKLRNPLSLWERARVRARKKVPSPLTGEG